MPTTLPFIPIADCISYAKISQFLISDDRAEQQAFKGGFLSKNSPQLIYTVRKSLEWAYDRNPSDINLVPISNLLYSLIRGYVNEAKVILSEGGTGTIVNPSTGIVSTIVDLPFQFTIGATGSLMNVGDTQLVLTYSSVVNNSEAISLDGTVLYRNLSDRASYTIVFNSTNVTITFNQAVAAGQTYKINLLQYQSI